METAYVCKKISKSIGIIYRSRFELSTNAKLSLYYTLIYPYLTYCNKVWSSTYVSSLNRILLLQKRAVRAITNSDYRAHSTPLFLDLKVLDIYKLNTFHIAKFMFKYHHNLLPPFFLNLFFTSYHVHNYNPRADGAKRRATVLIPPGYLHPGKRNESISQV
jgi:hypothetical protein